MVQILHEHSPPARAKLFETQPLHTKYDVLRAVLTRRRERDLLTYFAVPNVEPNGRQIVWSAPIDTTSRPVPLASLNAQERARLLDKVQSLHDDMLRLRESFADEGDSRSLRSLLTALLDVPDERHIYSVDGRPVFVYWSHEQERPIREVEFPRLERIGVRGSLPAGGQDEPVTAQPTAERIIRRDVVVARGWLVFVGAVSFFGIALASIALAALALYFLVFSPPWPPSAAEISVHTSQIP